MSSITSVKSKDRSSSSAGQKFWPLKKFGLHHHGKTDGQSIALTTTNTVKLVVVNEPAKGKKIIIKYII